MKPAESKEFAHEVYFGANTLLCWSMLVFVGCSEALWAFSGDGLGNASRGFAVAGCFLAPAITMLSFKDIIASGVTLKRLFALILSVISVVEIVLIFHDLLSNNPIVRHFRA